MLKRSLLCVTLLLIGCNGEPQDAASHQASVFKDENEELEYLKSLANPTVEQFRRRKDLDAKHSLERIAREQKRADDAYEYRAEFLLKDAKERIARHGAVVPESVVKALQRCIDEGVGTKAAAEAKRMLPEWEARVKAQ